MTPDTITPASTWRRFADAPPPNGFYWSRYADEPREWSTIVEVEGNNILLPGNSIPSNCESTCREYYTQPILPPP